MTQIKPISHFKANAAEIVRTIAEQEPYIITQNGEAKAVVIDYHSYAQQQETMALLKILALGRQEVREGKTQLASEVFDELRHRWQDDECRSSSE